jgi:hypothetical protein
VSVSSERLHRRLRSLRLRAAVRRWELQQLEHAGGAWFRLARLLAFARSAWAVDEADVASLNRQTPSFPLHVGANSTNGNGAHVTAGGVWTNGSSRASEYEIRTHAGDEAVATLAGLERCAIPLRLGDDGP